MLSTAAFSDPQSLADLGQTMPPLEEDLIQAIPSQITTIYWNDLPLALHDPTARTSAEGTGHTPPIEDFFLDPYNRESLSLGLESSLGPTLYAQHHPEGLVGFQRTGVDCCNPFPSSAHQQPIFSPWAINPYLSVEGQCDTTSAVPGTTIDRPLATHTSPPPSISNLSADCLTEYAEGIWQFLRVQGHHYECLWDDGSGRLCGYLGSLAGVKQHLRKSHRLKRYVLTC